MENRLATTNHGIERLRNKVNICNYSLKDILCGSKEGRNDMYGTDGLIRTVVAVKP